MKKVLLIFLLIIFLFSFSYPEENEETFLPLTIQFSLEGFILPFPFQSGYGVELSFDFYYFGFFFGGGYFWKYSWGWESIYQLDFGFLGIELLPLSIKQLRLGAGIVFLPEYEYPQLLIHNFPFLVAKIDLGKGFSLAARGGKVITFNLGINF